jgi:hypothetical protein
VNFFFAFLHSFSRARRNSHPDNQMDVAIEDGASGAGNQQT